MSPAESMVAVESMSGLVLGKFRPGRSAAELLEEADRHLQNAGHVLEHNDELIADLTLQNSLQVCDFLHPSESHHIYLLTLTLA